MSRNVFFCYLALILLAARPALAHPHVWIDYKVAVIAAPGGIMKLRFTWLFDAMFTAMVREDMKIKTMDDKAVAVLRDRAFGNLKNYHYYIYAKADGADFKPDKIEDFSARLVNGRQFEYEFTVALPRPAKNLDFVLYDAEFYVDIGPPMAESGGGGSFMKTVKPAFKPFVNTAGEGGAVAPVCEAHEGTPRVSEMWGKFPVVAVTCKIS